MVSISNPLNAAGAEKYYDRDNYYLESQGYWYGELADRLSLDGEIKDNEFKNILRGFDRNGVPLVNTAGKTDENGVLKHSSGIDLTFSAPKSVSILSYQDDRIQAAFDKALHVALNYAQNNLVQTRHKNKGEITFESTGNAAFAIFNHRTSRELDPQLHVHCVMMNLTQSENGKIMSMHNYNIFKNKILLGQIFRSELALEIQKIGYQVDITDRKKGFFEIRGVNNDIITDFSKRREQVVEQVKELREQKFNDLPYKQIENWAVERLQSTRYMPGYPQQLKAEIEKLQNSDEKVYAGWNDAELAALATTNSRIAKKNVTKEYIIEQINNTLVENNETLTSLTEKAQTQADTINIVTGSAPACDIEADIIGNMESMLQNEAAFTKNKLINAALKSSLGKYSYRQINEAFEKLCSDDEIVHLRNEYSIHNGTTPLYSSAEMKRLEEENINICKTSATGICVAEKIADQFIACTNDELHMNKILSAVDEEFNTYISELTDIDKQVMVTLREQFQQSKKSKKIPPPNAAGILQTHPQLKEFFYKNGQGFTEGQKNALRLMVATKCQFSVIQGDAGTGKSFSMMYAKNLLSSQGYSVRGLAPTGKATDELAKAARLKKSMTIHKFVKKWYASKKFRQRFQAGKECFVVDESGMIGSKTANQFIKIAKELDAKVVFVGDRKQFAAVEAGRFFADLQDRAGVDMAIMQDVMRQKTKQTKDIVKAISAKDFNTAFNHLLGYSLADTEIKKSKTKNYTVGQNLVFDCNVKIGLNNIVAGTNAKITNITKSRLEIEYKNKGKINTVSINPAVSHRFYKVFSQNSNDTKNKYENCIKEISEENERLTAIANDYLDCYAQKKDALVITATNDDRQKLNTIIRAELIKQKQVVDVGEFILHEPQNISEPTYANSYAIGQYVEISDTVKGIITDIDQNANIVSVCDTGGYMSTFDPKNYAKSPPSVFNEVKTTLGLNEKIAFLKNAAVENVDGKKVDIRNGQLATIISLDKKGNAIAQVGEGSDATKVKFNINENYNNFTTAYALSSHKSQGMTVDKIIWHANTSKEISTNSFYVAITRCKSEVAVYTDSTEILQKKSRLEQMKYSTIDDDFTEVPDNISETTNKVSEIFDDMIVDIFKEPKPPIIQSEMKYNEAEAKEYDYMRI